MPNVEIVALADVDQNELQRVAAEHGVAQTFTSFRDLLALPEIQAVDVCLHNNFHAPVSIAAMEAGKDVFCEKPMAGTYRDALAMYDAAQRLGRRLAIQNVMLFSPEIKAARRLIDAGMIGRPYYGRAVGFRRRGRTVCRWLWHQQLRAQGHRLGRRADRPGRLQHYDRALPAGQPGG